MEQTPFTYVYRMRQGYSARTSAAHPAIRAASLAAGIVFFVLLLVILIPLVLLFVVFFGIFWVIAKLKGVFGGTQNPADEPERENVRVIDR